MISVVIRTKSDKRITAVVGTAADAIALANVLEASEQVINFKVTVPGDGISQDNYGCGGFTKWTTLNY